MTTKTKKDRTGLKICFIIFSFALLVLYMLLTEDVATLAQKFSSLNYSFIILGLFFVFLSAAGDALSMHSIRLLFQKNASFASSYRSTLIGWALGFITPVQTGYLAGEIAYLNSNQGMKTSESATVLLKKTIMFICTSLVINGALILFNIKFFNLSSAVTTIVYLAMLGNVIYLIFLAMVARAEKILTKVTCALIRGLGKIRILKKPEETSKKATEEIHNLKENMSRVKISLPRTLTTLFFCAVQVLSLYMLTWCIYMAFNPAQPALGVFRVLCGQSFCTVIQQIAPIPGGLGLADTAFHNTMSQIMGDENVNISLFIWRLLSLYIPLAVGMAVLFLSKAKKSLKS